LRSGAAVLSPDNMEHLISSGGVSSYHDGVSQKSPGIFGIRGVWNAVDVTFMMNGLSQSKGADILRNPRLIFSPGLDEQVSFADVTEMFFPETWEPSEISSFNGFINNNNDDEDNNNASGSTVATGAIPSDFVRFGMSEDGIGGFGTILQVHSAEISEHGQFVTLALTTTTNEFEGFINWGSPINSAIYDGSGRIEYYQISPNYILQPMIKRYVENTKITLIPGSVLVMGGLKEAKHVRFEDKVPVLGDLPLVGRLFRSEGEQKIRKALIYFVKVDLVDPTGRDVKTGERPSSFTDSF
jgi:general secretion pathway protein D